MNWLRLLVMRNPEVGPHADVFDALLARTPDGAEVDYDVHNERRVDAVFASDDAIWPLYFAVVNRPFASSYINWCEHVPGASRYLFSIGSDPRDPRSWIDGTVYILPRETFTPTPESRELTSPVPVAPRALLHATPDDFPFRRQTRGHRRGESVRRVVARNVLRLPSPR